MGCSSSSNQFVIDNDKFSSERSEYNERNEKLELLSQDILDDCIKRNNGSKEGISNIIKEIKQIKNSSGNLSDNELNKTIKEIYVQQVLIKENLINEFDIENVVFEKFINLNHILINNYSQNEIELIFQNILIEFPKVQNVFIIDEDPKNFLEDSNLSSAFYTNLKFNKSFLVECLIIEFDNIQINNKNHINKLSEIIICNSNLKTLIIMFNNEIENNTNLSKIENIFDAIHFHKHLQCLIIINKNNNIKLELTTKIENILLDILKSSLNLFAFYMHKITLNGSFIESLSKTIPLNNKLKVFGIQISPLDEKNKQNIGLIDDLIIRGVGRSSLLASFFGGFILDTIKKAQYAQEKNNSAGNLKILEFDEEIKIGF